MLDLSRIESLGEALRDPTITYAGNVALIEANRHREQGRWTYVEFRREAEALAVKLQAAGCAAGERCAILMSNQARWAISGAAALWSGCVLVPLDYKLDAKDQAALLAHSQPRVLVTEYPIWRSLVREHQAFDKTVVLVSEAPSDADLGRARRWEEQAEGAFSLVPRGREDVASIVYSSGTGGRPKGCMLTHHNYLEQAQVLGRLFPMLEDERYLSVLPTNHAIDFMCGMVVPFLFGAAVVHQRTLRPEFMAPTMKRYGVTHTALVPRILKNMEARLREQLDELPEWKRLLVDGLMEVNQLATGREPNHRLSRTLLRPIHERFGGRLKLIFCGGAFLDPATARFFYRLGLPVVIGYGLTEACTVLTVNDLKPFRADTVGRPVPGTEIQIRDPNAAGIGEVYARGPTIMKGYLDEPALSEQTLDGGWLRTGDLGFIDASGHLKLVGRAKNMIVTEGGKNVYPEDVEVAFDDLDGCEEVCVFASNFIWPGEGLQNEQLVVVLRPRRRADIQHLLQSLRAKNRRLSDYKRVHGCVIWTEEFPRTASMKIKREQLARDIGAATSRERELQSL